MKTAHKFPMPTVSLDLTTSVDFVAQALTSYGGLNSASSRTTSSGTFNSIPSPPPNLGHASARTNICSAACTPCAFCSLRTRATSPASTGVRSCALPATLRQKNSMPRSLVHSPVDWRIYLPLRVSKVIMSSGGILDPSRILASSQASEDRYRSTCTAIFLPPTKSRCRRLVYNGPSCTCFSEL
jgi:hypothetical protein